MKTYNINSSLTAYYHRPSKSVELVYDLTIDDGGEPDTITKVQLPMVYLYTLLVGESIFDELGMTERICNSFDVSQDEVSKTFVALCGGNKPKFESLNSEDVQQMMVTILQTFEYANESKENPPLLFNAALTILVSLIDREFKRHNIAHYIANNLLMLRGIDESQLELIGHSEINIEIGNINIKQERSFTTTPAQGRFDA